MQAQQPSATPAPSAAAATAAGLATPSGARAAAGFGGEWSEHTAPDGRTYYYNKVTKKSSWVQPAQVLQQQMREGLPAPAAAVVGGDWAEFTAPDCRKYYHNKTTKESRWRPPPGWQPQQPLSVGTAAQVKAVSGAVSGAALPPTAAAAVGTTHTVPPRVLQPGPTPHYATATEAKAAFKQLLVDCRIPSGLGWVETQQAVAGDRRFGALKTAGERKAAFFEYVQHMKGEEAEEGRRQRMKVSGAVGRVAEHARNAPLFHCSGSRPCSACEPLVFSINLYIYDSCWYYSWWWKGWWKGPSGWCVDDVTVTFMKLKIDNPSDVMRTKSIL